MPVKILKELNPAAVNVEEAARYIGSSKSELDKARITGFLSGIAAPIFFRIGRAVRYRITDLNDWLASQPAFTTNAQAEAK